MRRQRRDIDRRVGDVGIRCELDDGRWSIDHTADDANETASTQRPATTAAPVAPTSEPAPTVPAEPVGIRDHLQLTAGWSYHTRNFDVPFGWTMPATDDLGRWGVLFDTGNYVIVTLNLADKERPEVVREEPGFVFSAVPPANDVDEAIALWLAEAETRESFVAEQSTGAFLGTETAVVSGSYEITTPAPGAYFIRLADDFTVPVAPGERRYVSYFVPVGDRVVIVSINGHAVDFDLVVTLAGQILDSLEFA